MIKMKFLLGILFAIFLVSKSEENCTRNGVSCPNYEVLNTFDGYEVRLYPEATFVSTKGEAKQRRHITRSLIKRLYRYIGGYNEEKTQIELMVPVRTLKSPGEDYNNYTLSFFLPKEHSANPPKPLDSRVFLNKEPATVYAVRSFGGFARDERIWDDEARILSDLSSEFESRGYFWAVYDPPVRHRNRLNEVWIPVNNDKEENEIF